MEGLHVLALVTGQAGAGGGEGGKGGSGVVCPALHAPVSEI